jgi:predicted ATPase with chaperone activity
MPDQLRELAPEVLRRRCNPDDFTFDTTGTLPELDHILGQPRALAALESATHMTAHGFNLFALGLPGSGKTQPD